MRRAEFLNLAYFCLFTLLALVWTLPPRSRKKAILLGLGGLALTATGLALDRWMPSDATGIIRDWLPTPLMAFAYWQSGFFFSKANPRLQAIFDHSERALMRLLHINVSKVSRTWFGALLEFAYVFCYPVVPLGLAALYFTGFRHAVDVYWTVVLLSAYPCYALLPFVQLKPPRLIEKSDDSTTRSFGVRRLNLWLAGRVSHGANTFPSGHVAASAAIALTLFRFVPLAGIVFAFIAAGIAAGCVVGRYHYIVDVVAALLLAATMFLIAT